MQKVISRSIYNLKIDTIYVYDIPFDRPFLELSNGIRHVMPSTDRKLELTVKASMAQPVSQPAVCSNGLIRTEHLSRRWNVSVSAWKWRSLDESVIIWVYFAYNCVTKSLDQPAYSRDFAPGASHPFLRVKQTLGGRTFEDDSFKRSMPDHKWQERLSNKEWKLHGYTVHQTMLKPFITNWCT